MKSKADFPALNTKQPGGLKPSGKPYRVMVVEDKDFQRKQIVQILESERYEIVATAQNGREALDKFDKISGPIDLITTDLDMPVLDGYAMLYELKSKPKKPLVVFISEETTKGVMQDLISLGISDFILKPVNRKTILDRVKAALVKKAQTDRAEMD
ncbi:MAG: response regulator [Spirochaetes bacterium]|nr:response regulator [Spirochaetota bacterium]